MIDKKEWSPRHAQTWNAVYWHFGEQRQPYYFDDWRGYARCFTDAQRGDERAGQWIAEFARRLMS